VNDQSGNPVVGAVACVPTKPNIPCATSDPSGTLTLEFPYAPSLDDDAVSVTDSGYIGGVALITDGQLPGGFYTLGGYGPILWTTAYATMVLGTEAGFTVSSTTTGYVVVESHVAGATATISPAAPSGAVYTDGSGDPDPTATSTAAGGEIYFGNVTPGHVAITVMLNGQQCTDGQVGSDVIGGVWATQGSESADAYVVAGSVTHEVQVFCP
jgi:hypothetical protein